MEVLCSYGCGNIAIFFFKDGRGCCNEKRQKCTKMREKNSIANKNKRLSIEHRTKISNSLKGFKHTKERVDKMSNSLKGRKSWNEGLKLPEEIGNKISESMKGKDPWNKGLTSNNDNRILCGLDHPFYNKYGPESSNWKGGKSLEPYCVEFTNELKNMIKERDEYECQNEDCWKKENSFLTVHHINYDKLNCHPNNLITLCNSCNSRANGKREFWEKYFKIIVKEVDEKK